MPRYRYRSYRPRPYRSYNYGAERAREHIHAAEKLTKELGGADEKVKQWLFSIRGPVLERILDTYGKEYGSSARSYAAGVIPKWESGSVRMSGMVAERLFTLLPPHMPFSVKYDIVESMWRHFGPSSSQTIWVNPDVGLDQLMADVQQRIDAVVTNYRIPPNLEERFSWLASDDVGVKQQLLNHLRSTDKAMAVATAKAKIPVLVEHMKSEQGGLTKHLSQTLTVGKHELQVVIDRHATGIQTTRPIPPTSPGTIIFRVVLALAVLVFLLYACTHR
jgi:hypothetical protein